MYYAIGVSVPSLHRESTDSLIISKNQLDFESYSHFIEWY